MFMWFLRKERNAHFLNGPKLPEDGIVARAGFFLTDYKSHQTRDEVAEHAPSRMTTDAAIFPDGEIGLRAVARDSDGKLRMVAAKRTSGGSYVDQAKALAVEMGVQLAPLLHEPKLILECDSMMVINKLNDPMGDLTETGVICRSIRRSLEGAEQHSWLHIRREANGAAHLMARTYTHRDERLVWLDSIPDFWID
ncbi:unnamed protein product [Linum trigynum]|uniref:RNase H type-1 domain-containing protein n=1 Tax=Linum trigynum TaxID=586398 RepID=A0AAV2GSE5_9ROSI